MPRACREDLAARTGDCRLQVTLHAKSYRQPVPNLGLSTEISALQQGHQRELADVYACLAAAHSEISSLWEAHQEESEVSAHDARVAAALATERAEQAESDLARVSTEIATAQKAARFLADKAKDRYVKANHEACIKEITMLREKLGSHGAVIHAIHPGGLTDPDLPELEDVPAGRSPSLLNEPIFTVPC
ncbi:UNVERIFIED_CONTAM: hypothetical protein K2H54_035005 [Gekko kuhli]